MSKNGRTAVPKVSAGKAVGGSTNGESPVSSTSGPAADERIRMRAYELYRERGGRVGDDMADWLQAEREYLERAPKSKAAPTGPGVAASPELRV